MYLLYYVIYVTSIVWGIAEILKLCYRKGGFVGRENLKKARKEKGMTQQDVADCLNVGLRHYQKIEEGTTIGSVKIWDALEDILEINQRKLRELS